MTFYLVQRFITPFILIYFIVYCRSSYCNCFRHSCPLTLKVNINNQGYSPIRRTIVSFLINFLSLDAIELLIWNPRFLNGVFYKVEHSTCCTYLILKYDLLLKLCVLFISLLLYAFILKVKEKRNFQ